MEASSDFDELLALTTSDISTWKESDKQPNCQTWKRDVQPKTTLCLRAQMLFPGVPPEVAFTCIADIRVR